MEQVEPARARPAEPVLNVGQLRFEDRSPPRHEVVRLPELRDAVASPVIPRELRRLGHRIIVAFQHRDVATVAGKECALRAGLSQPWRQHPTT